jgi:hypothetical protein
MSEGLRPRTGPHRASQSEPRASGGAEGNERLTAMTGAVLLVLLAAEGFTILSLRQLLTPHFFIGMLLLGPVALKAGSTIYRFARYYTGSALYRRKGPPGPRPGRGYGGRATVALSGRGLRLALLVASLVAGLVIAVLTVHLAVPWHFGGGQ